MGSEALISRLKRTWRVRCPDCLGLSTRTEGVWSRTEQPRVVWTCPTCNGDGEVDVQLAKGASSNE